MAVTLDDMRLFLSRAYPTPKKSNRPIENKINGIYAEIGFLDYITSLGYGGKVSRGGWIMRPTRIGQFGTGAIAVFPEVVTPGTNYPLGRPVPMVPPSVDAAANELRKAKIHTYYCFVEEQASGELSWNAMLRGFPSAPPPTEVMSQIVPPFIARPKPWNFLRHNTDVSKMADVAVPSQFSLESLRVHIQSNAFAETSDIDRLLWGAHHIYPVEVKEKTRVVKDKNFGDWFGIDVGPFSKLAFFAAWYGQLKSLFVVREIDHEDTRNLVQWWAIEFSDAAKYGSWVWRAGGPSMRGTPSATLPIPIHAFRKLDAAYLASL